MTYLGTGSPSRPEVAATRRWTRVSLRGLILLILIASLPIGWTANRINSQRRAIAAIRGAGGYVWFDYQMTPSGQWDPNINRPDRGRFARWLPPELFEDVTLVNLKGRPIGDGELAQVGRLSRLVYLDLEGTNITDDGLASLRGCRSLKHLWLPRTSIGDAGAKHLAAMPGLENLLLNETRIGDDGLKTLTRLDRLRSLGVKATRVGQGAADVYRRDHPKTALDY